MASLYWNWNILVINTIYVIYRYKIENVTLIRVNLDSHLSKMYQIFAQENKIKSEGFGPTEI